jgi:hypothetical protein
MSPSTRSARLKKIHQFLQSLVEGNFLILFIFQWKLHFVDLFFSNSPFGVCCTCHPISSDCLGFRLSMMFVWHMIRAGLSGCSGKWVHMQSVGEERNPYRHLCPCLVQYGTTGKCPSFCYRNFFVIFLNCTFIPMSIYNFSPSLWEQ